MGSRERGVVVTEDEGEELAEEMAALMSKTEQGITNRSAVVSIERVMEIHRVNVDYNNQ